MKLYEFLNMAVEETYDCYIYDNEKEEDVFVGMISDIPDELLIADMTSWEMYNGTIGFNVDKKFGDRNSKRKDIDYEI